MKVVDGRTYRLGESLEDFAHGTLRRLAMRRLLVVPPVERVDPLAGPAVAWIYEGMWVATCPDPDCKRPTVLVWRDNPFFMCPECWNVAAGGAWRRVAFPEQAEAIEEVLEVREYAHQANWLPHERVGDLVRENRAHGLPEPQGSKIKAALAAEGEVL